MRVDHPEGARGEDHPEAEKRAAALRTGPSPVAVSIGGKYIRGMQTSPMPDVERVERIEQATRGLLGGIGRLSRTLFRAGEYGLPRSYASALDALEEAPRRVTDLAPFTGLTQPRVTVVLQELEERGLVQRQRCTEDRRVTRVFITPLGRELLEQARQRMLTALLGALHANVDDPEATVIAASEAVCALVKALEPEVS
jgi:DNA-binding MarR family transcriptional regulator